MFGNMGQLQPSNLVQGYDPRGIPNEEDRMKYGNVGNTRMAGLGLDPLFGRTFAGKPV